MAERMGLAWLAQGAGHQVTVVATARAGDEEMQARIAQHRRERPQGFDTLEAPLQLGQALRAEADPGRLLIIDCLTLWLTHVQMPEVPHAGAEVDWPGLQADLLASLRELDSPVVLVSNEIGWGVVPMGAEVRRFVDDLGRLNQEVAQCCAQLTLMAAGQAFTRDVERWA